MISYDWPGNVRELQNWIRFALVKCKGDTIRPEHFPPTARPVAPRTSPAPNQPAAPSPGGRKKPDEESVRAALRNANGNKRLAARILGVSRATLYRFLDKSGAIG